MDAGNRTQLQKFFLNRLGSMAQRRSQEVALSSRLFPDGELEGPVGEDIQWHLRLLNRAIYSSYLDCLEAGVGDEARELIGELRQVSA